MLSLREALTTDAPVGLRSKMIEHGVRSVRTFLASISARKHYRLMYGRFSELGEITGPIESVDDGYRLPTVAGNIKVQSGNLEPTSFVTYAPLVEYLALRVDSPNETYDDPYIIFAVTTLNPNHSAADSMVAVRKIGPLEDVSKGKIYADTNTIWEDRIVSGTGIKISVGAFDYDLGDPDDVGGGNRRETGGVRSKRSTGYRPGL